VLVEDRFTEIPPEGANPLSVTVPIEVDPPTTEFGDREILASVGALTVIDVDTDIPSEVALICGLVLADTGTVVTVNVVVVAPVGTTTY